MLLFASDKPTMAGGKELKMSKLFFILYLFSCLIGFIQCDTEPHLEILPIQEIQRKPVGKPLMLTCRPYVPDTNLITDLQWRDNQNMTIPPKPTGQTQPAMYTEILPGDQSLALIIPSLKETMAGKYYCSASYASSQLLEIAVTIETYVAITWKNAPENQFPILGEDFIVRCEVTAYPAPSVDWLRNGDQIKNGDKYILQSTGLLIKNVEESDDGVYTCRAAVIQTGELVERNIRVEVHIKPEITYLSTSLEAIEDQSFSTFCNATGKPIPEIIWIKDKTQQNVATADRFLVNPQTGLLTITKVQQEDYDTYTCMAKNDAGSAEAQTKLNVLVRPKIFELYNETKVINKEAVLACRAHGRPAPEITFRRWGSDEEFVQGPQRNDDRIILEQFGDNEKGESSGTLRIQKLMRTDDGLYECIARNKGDTAYKVGHITVEYPPDFTYMKSLPPVYTWEERPANLSCIAESFPNATIEWRWRGQLIKDMYDQNIVIEGKGPVSNLIIKPYDQRYYSEYKCIATNKYGTAEVDIILREGKRPTYVSGATPKIVTATTMTFDIIGPSPEPGLPIIAYSVRYREDRNPDWSQAQIRDWSPDSPYIVEGLKPQTAYVFEFAARNQVGLGPWGATKLQTTPRRSAPEVPKTLHTVVQNDDEEPIVMSPYSDHFELRWSVPADNGEPIDFYQVKFCPGLKVNGEWSELGNECITREVIETTSFEMSRLNPNTYYRIELRAHNPIGFSVPSSIMMKTARGADVVLRVDKTALSSAAIIGIAIGGVLLLLLIIDFLCCVTLRMGVLASMCRKAKRSPSDIDEETKLGSLYGWRFPLPYCSGQLVKEPPPSPLPLPPPVKLGGSPMASPLEEKQPLNTPPGSYKKESSLEFDGRLVHSRSGDIIGKNSAV